MLLMSCMRRKHVGVLAATGVLGSTQQASHPKSTSSQRQRSLLNESAASRQLRTQQCCCHSPDMHVAATSDCFTCRCKHEAATYAQSVVRNSQLQGTHREASSAKDIPAVKSASFDSSCHRSIVARMYAVVHAVHSAGLQNCQVMLLHATCQSASPAALIGYHHSASSQLRCSCLAGQVAWVVIKFAARSASSGALQQQAAAVRYTDRQ
jgi:hypothetical protein